MHTFNEKMVNAINKYGINVGMEGKATDLAVTEIEERKLGCQGMLFKRSDDELSLDGIALDIWNGHIL